MLKVNKIKKKYDDISIFENISFSIPNNSIVALLGENGIGKTTLLKILSGIIEFNGDIFIDNISLKNNFNSYINEVAYIPNTPFLYDYLTVSEMIDLVISFSKKEFHKSQYTLKNKLLSELNLSKYEDMIIKNLSLGSKQKVSYIVSFISIPSIILIDEPFVNFDNKSLENILKFIKKYINENNSIIIFATHSEDLRISSIITHEINIKSNTTVEVVKKR